MSKETDLDALAAAVRNFVNLEVPTAAQWNVNPDVLRNALGTLGDFFTSVEAAHAALQALFEQDHDPITGANAIPSEWVVDPNPPTYLSATQFRLTGDRRADYTYGDRIRVTLAGQPYIVAIASVPVFTSGNTTITVDKPWLINTLSKVEWALVRTATRKVTFNDIMEGAVLGSAMAQNSVTTLAIAALNVTNNRLAINATRSQTTSDEEAQVPITFDGVERAVVTVTHPASTRLNARTLLLASGTVWLDPATNNTAVISCSVRLTEGGYATENPLGTVLAEASCGGAGGAAAVRMAAMSHPFCVFADVPATLANRTFRLTVEGGGAGATGYVSDGKVLVIESA
jgi:hypothetical protein